MGENLIIINFSLITRYTVLTYAGLMMSTIVNSKIINPAPDFPRFSAPLSAPPTTHEKWSIMDHSSYHSKSSILSTISNRGQLLDIIDILDIFDTHTKWTIMDHFRDLAKRSIISIISNNGLYFLATLVILWRQKFPHFFPCWLLTQHNTGVMIYIR